MLYLQYLRSFYIYNFLLIITFSVLINPIKELEILNESLYCFFHFLLIYLAFYHFSKILYLIFFTYGLMIDIFFYNEIGPHIFSFILILTTINFLSKYLYDLNAKKIYFLLLFFQLCMIFIEIFLSFIFFNFIIYHIFITKIILLSVVLSYPIFIFFNKIDSFN